MIIPNKVEWIKFRKKPVVIEAINWNGDKQKIKSFFGDFDDWFFNKYDQLVINTLEGNHRANLGDWIIKGVKGEFYPCKPDIFEQTYEEADWF